MDIRDDRSGFARHLCLPGWSAGSAWGYDEVLECYWAVLEPTGTLGPSRRVLIGPEHLIPTIPGLARALAFAAEVGDDEVYLALTA